MRKQTGIITLAIIILASITGLITFSDNLPLGTPAMLQEFTAVTERATGDLLMNRTLRLVENINGIKKEYYGLTFARKAPKGMVINLNGEKIKLSEDATIPYYQEVVLSYDKDGRVNWYTLFNGKGEVLVSRAVK